jgi:K+-transporting ATPase ATPase A chain
VFLILLLPASLPFVFGRFAGNMRQGWAVYAVMILLFATSLTAAYLAESAENPRIAAQGVTGPSMEGKEVRFGLAGTMLFTVATTATSCGAVNSMIDSYAPLGGLVPMFLILLGEVVFGGVGSGIYTMLAYVVIAVFIAGLMIGRTPEYLGKKIEVFEMQMALVTILVPGVLVLVFTGIAVVIPAGLDSILNPGPHGLSEVIYAFASMANNNGSAFGGLNAAAFYYAISGVGIMAIGRFVPAVAILAFAGSVAAKKIIPPGPGTLPTNTPVFVFWVIAIIIIVGILTFFPLFALGPIIEHLHLAGGV